MVVYPRNENDVRKTARFSWQLAERGRVIPMTARGLGSDQSGAAIRGIAGGTQSATAASAASGATLSTIAHGLAAAPTNFQVNAGNAAAAAIVANGYFVTADGTNVSVATAASAASGPYAWQWIASP